MYFWFLYIHIQPIFIQENLSPIAECW
jgi:hypothetical protein